MSLKEKLNQLSVDTKTKRINIINELIPKLINNIENSLIKYASKYIDKNKYISLHDFINIYNSLINEQLGQLYSEEYEYISKQLMNHFSKVAMLTVELSSTVKNNFSLSWY
ncbi:MAG TPA: hypothetical protein VLG50_06550 [Candidatus Saccharimonadales bacterium]|nr:hypothetical protein [Candidatus Saccharimonadales bacterium]